MKEDVDKIIEDALGVMKEDKPIVKKETPMSFKRERLSDEDNEKINEIFDEFDDDFIPKKTIH